MRGRGAHWDAALQPPPVSETDPARWGTMAQYRQAIATGPCLCEGHGTVTPDVPPDHPAFGKSFPCSCAVRRRAERLRGLFRTAGIPPRFARLSFASFDALSQRARRGKAGLIALARQFADVEAYRADGGVRLHYPHLERDVIRPGVLFYGPCGTGKTAAAALVARAWADAGLSVMFITYLDFVTAVQDSYSEGGALKRQRIAAAQSVDLLVLDDLGRARWGQGQQSDDKTNIFDLVAAHRHAYEKATLFTTNLEPQDLEAQFDQRLAGRIVYELCHAMGVGGLDLRPLNAA